MKARLIDLEYTFTGKQRLLIEIDTDFADKFNSLHGKDVEVSIDTVKKGRTLRANSYFHVLVGRIADAQARIGCNESNDAVKKRLIQDYGTQLTGDDGNVVALKLPSDIDVDSIYPYSRCYDTRTTEDGRFYKCYVLYKQSHLMNTEEMCRLIDGAIQEAKDLGVDTDTPEQVAKMKAQWREQERKKE